MSERNAKPGLVKSIWHAFARCVITALICSFYRVRMFGAENVPSTGPVILLCNHQSFFDPMFSQAWVKRNFHFVARDSLFELGLFSLLIKSLHTIPIKRGQADIAAMKIIIEKLKLGMAVCLYPEATRTADGKIAPLRPGFALLSRKGNAPVLPVVIDGAYESWPRHKKYPSFGRVAVSYGTAITCEQIKQLGDRQVAELMTRQMRNMQTEMRKKLGKVPFDYSQPTESGCFSEVSIEK